MRDFDIMTLLHVYACNTYMCGAFSAALDASNDKMHDAKLSSRTNIEHGIRILHLIRSSFVLAAYAIAEAGIGAPASVASASCWQ